MNLGQDRRSPEKADKQLHELQVHQAELEAQNEELRRTQIELDHTRARYFDLYDLAPVGYFTINETETILEANLTAASLLGLHDKSLIGRPIRKYILPADQDVYYSHRRKLVDTGAPQTCELRMTKMGNAPFWAQLMSTIGQDAEGSVLHRLVVTDIDVRKNLDQALQLKNLELQAATSVAEKANMAKSEFLSSMSHELRSPLNAIVGFAQLLESGTPAPTLLQQRNIERILAGGWYLLKLINEILDLALIESGKLALSLQPVPLAQLLLECQNMIEPQSEKHGIPVQFREMEYPLWAVADPVRLKQVMVNLLSNAIKYNRPGGRVEVCVQADVEGTLRISVKDTGEGLSTDKVAQLFTSFNRLGRERTTTEGTGIGLVVTKKLTELMGGTIGVQSSFGVGSEFWVEFKSAQTPAVALSQEQLACRAQPLQGGQNQPRSTVLYVEDNPANVDLVQQILERRENLLLFSASNGQQGIEMARKHRPHVILMDINLPGMSGLEALKILSQDAATRHIPVIAVSANAMPLDVVSGLSAGFFRYLTKPFQIDRFLEVLDLALAQSLSTEAIKVR
jgi:PAS domain S-box-containing protein